MSADSSAHPHSHDHDHDHADHDHAHGVPDGVTATAVEEGPALRRIEVTVAADRVRRAYDRAYRALGKQARVKGFRPGKVPRRVLERMYGASLAEEIERELVNESLAPAVEQAGVEPVATPTVEATPPRPDGDFHYVARVEVRPPVALPELEGLPGKRPAVLVGDDEIERELQNLRERQAPIVEEPEGTAAEEGHILSVDFVGRIDGQPFEGGSGRDVEIELGTGRFVPGFEEQLVGAQAGEDREVRVRFPQDYGNAELAGRDAVFQAHVAAVKRRKLPDLDDEFAKDLGEFDTLDALRDRIHADLQDQRREQAEGALRRSLVEALLERAPVDVPPGAADAQLEQRLRGAAQQLQGAVPEDALRAQLERWREEWRPAAQREVAERWLLEAVAEQAGVEVEDAEVSERLERLAAGQGASVQQLREAVGAGALEGSVRRELRREKALDFLVSTARVEEVSDT